MAQEKHSVTFVGHVQVHQKKPYMAFILDIKKGDQTWKVYKRYSQFDELNDQLKKRFKNLPKFPKKRFFGSWDDEEFARKREKELEAYIQGLQAMPEVVAVGSLSTFFEFEKNVVPIGVVVPQGSRPNASAAARNTPTVPASLVPSSSKGKERTRDDVLREILDKTAENLIDVAQAPAMLDPKDSAERQRTYEVALASLKVPEGPSQRIFSALALQSASASATKSSDSQDEQAPSQVGDSGPSSEADQAVFTIKDAPEVVAQLRGA